MNTTDNTPEISDTKLLPHPETNSEPAPLIALPEIEDGAALVLDEVDEPAELINGLLHVGSKCVIGGGSKSFKTWILLHMAISVSQGLKFWDHDTNAAKVLYINFEIQKAFFAKRLKILTEKLNTTLKSGDLDIWNLRGYCTDWTFIGPSISKRIEARKYHLIIIDPIYKCLGGRDENKAGEIAELLNQLEALAVQSGAAVVFGAHFSKGNQAAKESIDRMSGSGVFARDPDTIITLTPHKESGAFVVDCVLRNFPPIDAFCVEWEYPLMRPAPELNPHDLKKGNQAGKRQPSDEEFLFLLRYSDFDDRHPEAFMRSTDDLLADFAANNYDKRYLASIRDRLEKDDKIGVVKLARGKILTGLPEAAAAYRSKFEGKAEKKSKKRDSK